MQDAYIEYYKSIANSLPILVWIIRPDGRQEYFNQKWYDYVGKDFKMNVPNKDLVHPDDINMLQTRWKESLDTNVPFEFEYRLLGARDKKYKWFLAKAYPIRNANKTVVGWFGTSININNEKNSRVITRGALDSLGAQIAVIDQKGKIIQVNKAWTEFATQNGIHNTSSVGEGVNYLTVLKKSIKDPDVKIIYEGIKDVLSGKKEKFGFEYPCHSVTQERWYLMTVHPFQGDEGGAVISHTNITDRVKAELSLRSSEEYNRTLVDNSPDRLIVLDTQGNIQSINPAGLRSLNLENIDSIKGKSWIDIWDPRYKPKIKTVLKQVQGGRYAHFQAKQAKLDKKDTVDRWWDVLINPLRIDKKIVGILVASRDITRLKELEDQKNQFIGIVSHELKTPVTSIRIFNAAFRKIAAKLENTVAQNIAGKMETQIVKLTRLITDLLDVTKIQSGKLSFAMQDFVLEDVIKECIEQVQETSENHKITNEIKTKSHIYADPDRTSQVILNLLINAIKYSPNSDKIIVTSEKTGKSVKICIQDFGIGIRKAQQKKIFRQYYQVSDNKKENFPGLGLGLYLSAYFVRRVNGKIWVESEINKGSTFCVEFPLHKKKFTNEKNTDS